VTVALTIQQRGGISPPSGTVGITSFCWLFSFAGECGAVGYDGRKCGKERGLVESSFVSEIVRGVFEARLAEVLAEG
jgi:hypothetical protein